MATSEGIPSSIDIEFLELNDNPYLNAVYVQANQFVILLTQSILLSLCFNNVIRLCEIFSPNNPVVQFVSEFLF